MTVKVDRRWAVNDLPAVILDNGVLRVTVLPDLGGKVLQVTSLRTGRDLLWENPRTTLRQVPFGATYDDVFFGGWDELFPNDEAEQIQGEAFPDHGELWASPWRVVEAAVRDGAARVILELETPISQCSIRKTLTLAEQASALEVSWRLTNQGLRALPYLWKQHVAVPASEPARLDLPRCDMLMEGFGTPRAGGAGATYTWPFLTGEDGTRHDMRQTLPRSSGAAEFQYATNLDAGWCAVTYQDGTGLGLAFDPTVFRSCWTFASYGGWRGAEVLVLEPCTGYPVSVADGIAAGTHQVLPAGSVIETSMTLVAYEGMSQVTNVDPHGRVEGTRASTEEPVR